jgi:hypothetical protein
MAAVSLVTELMEVGQCPHFPFKFVHTRQGDSLRICTESQYWQAADFHSHGN